MKWYVILDEHELSSDNSEAFFLLEQYTNSILIDLQVAYQAEEWTMAKLNNVATS